MAFLVVICLLAFVAFGIIGIVSAIRKKPAKIKFLLSLVSFILMIVFTVVAGNSDSDKTLQTADTSTKTSTNNNDNSTPVSAETGNNAEQVKADAEAKAAAEAEAKKKADADAKADAEKKEKESAAIKAKQDAALAQMEKTVDEVEGITWYQDKEAPKYINENGIYAYFGIKDGQITSGLRLKIQYAGDSWIFIKNYVFNIDGQKFEINPGFMGAERDMSTDINSPGVWEYYDKTLNKSQINMLTQLIESEKTIMRLEGDQRKEDRTIDAKQKAALKRVFDAYIAAGGEV